MILSYIYFPAATDFHHAWIELCFRWRMRYSYYHCMNGEKDFSYSLFLWFLLPPSFPQDGCFSQTHCARGHMTRSCNKNTTTIFTCGFSSLLYLPVYHIPAFYLAKLKEGRWTWRRKVISSMMNKLFSTRFIIDLEDPVRWKETKLKQVSCLASWFRYSWL